VEEDETAPSTTPTPKKKKMGRPKGSKTKVKKIVVQDDEAGTTTPKKKKKIGRPKGSKTKKQKDETTTTIPSPAKKMGRPKGGKKNKKHPVPSEKVILSDADEKRSRIPSRRLQETMEFDQFHHKEQNRPKRKYTKRKPSDTGKE
jgi:hypothetical protein